MALSEQSWDELYELLVKKQSEWKAINAQIEPLQAKADVLAGEMKNFIAILQGNMPTKQKESPELINVASVVRTTDDPLRGRRESVIIDVLKESGQPMKGKDIRAVLERRGTPINQNTFDAIMSKMMKEPEKWPIFKPQYGFYQYQEQIVAQQT